jgi:hypothetical protein
MGVRLNNFIKVLNSSSSFAHNGQHECLTSRGKPLNFEQFQRDHAFVFYSTTLDKGGRVLTIPDLNDHAYVYLDGEYQGNLSVCQKTGCARSVNVTGRMGQRLDILVESAGRLTFPLTKVDPKVNGHKIGQNAGFTYKEQRPEGVVSTNFFISYSIIHSQFTTAGPFCLNNFYINFKLIISLFGKASIQGLRSNWIS